MNSIRVLQVLGLMNRGGAESMIMNLYRNIDRNKVQFDFVVHHEEKGDFDDEIKRLGGRIFYVPQYKIINHLEYIRAWKKLLNEHCEWEIIHGHMYSTASIYLKIAKQAGRYTIAHSHSTSNGKGISAFVKNIYEMPLKYTADSYIGCSEAAGKWLFGNRIVEGNNYVTLPNAIDIEKFKYNKNIRKKIREELKIENNIVLGHIGRDDYAKNLEFLLNIIDNLVRINPNYMLLQVGEAKHNNNLQKYIVDEKLQDNVKFLGVRDDVADLIQAMDIFLLPSRYEGLPVVIIEAQASGLPCLISDKVTKEVGITESVKYISIENGVEDRVKTITKEKIHRNIGSEEIIKEEGYDIKTTANWLEDYYLSI